MSDFCYFSLTGNDGEKFLQDQVTADVQKLSPLFTPTAICNLAGRVQFGLWLQKLDAGFGIVISADLATQFANHIKKYGAFSRIELSQPTPIYPCILQDMPSFAAIDHQQQNDWRKLSIAQGNYWLSQATSEIFQPQELRLHQQGGVAYDKGCYLGQEVVARLYFKSKPKAYLHRVAGKGAVPQAGDKLDKITIVNAIATQMGYEALVVARPEDILASSLAVLPLPEALQADVGRE
ncbi:hypothetical protein SAMN02745664_103101 [Moraxella cuniculi DSM 21768]|uniref:Aminomethyltransferase folate-binding domain-containing protein n=1 Tax=Moraxella cuniculi DSM 21768 TaxID=1122245 RepID=A0A1N7E5M3_9GAMM|nr:folate-binding protein YgfZ [Moraxella cuniculi]OOS06628.1 folate-binding protein YgfZ [Moraxella cuniculi]SIR83361.1 hypothetical protein SAMN02745664_103101 [Moraxella cuniculi DSM 21768]